MCFSGSTIFTVRPGNGVPQLTIWVAAPISETSVVMRAFPRATAFLLTEIILRPPSDTARVFSASPYATKKLSDLSP